MGSSLSSSPGTGGIVTTPTRRRENHAQSYSSRPDSSHGVESIGSNSNNNRPRSHSFPTRLNGENGEDAGVAKKSLHTWCNIKAKTRLHNSHRVKTRMLWYEAKPESSFVVGRDPASDLRLDDDRCGWSNAKIEPYIDESTGKPSGGVTITPTHRMYQLVGMGGKKNMNETKLEIGTVIKVGSVSLEVTDMCTSESDDFVDRFAVELNSSRRKSSSRNLDEGSRKQSEGAESSGSNEAESELSLEGVNLDEKNDDEEASEEVEDIGDNEVAEDERICFICWGGVDGAEVATSVGQEADEANPLINNPCGKCSGSSRYVHLHCLLSWIKSSGSGHCSVCNNALPQHFSSPPPNIEFKVVRHRRGQQWVGTRRFRLSFKERDVQIIGREMDADVKLSDRSVGTRHAKVVFDRETRTFLISDCSSLGGTYILVKNPLQLSPESATYLKIGRTLLLIRLTQRKGTMLNMLQNPWSWTKR